jgi:predicted amidohydrolase YtcJ
VLIHDAEIEQGGERVRADVLLQGGRIERIGSDLGDAAGGPRFEARGAALLPALHDHHIHLRALAAALRSVACGPPAVALATTSRSRACSIATRSTGSHPVAACACNTAVAPPGC